VPMAVIDFEKAPDPWPLPGQARMLTDGALRVTVLAEHSDRLLRDVLATYPNTHVRSLRTVEGGQEL